MGEHERSSTTSMITWKDKGDSQVRYAYMYIEVPHLFKAMGGDHGKG